ncbi:MAG: FAD-dependent oxidoreductase [Eubacteriales bacterium]|nr:FAD-dependent oxidoreductase [Eubacteriales bacterium]
MEKFDAIVVGAGPAGLSAAITMADKGLKVIVIERGDYPGAKNVMGGILYSEPTAQIFPEFWKEAPLERPITEESYWFLTGDSVTKFGHRNQRFAEEPYNAFSVFRAHFDKWMGEKLKAKGGLLICETVVEDVIEKDGKVIGVKCGRANGDIYADVVIVAEGVNSMLTQKALKMQKMNMKEDYLAVAVKEVIYLDEEKIEDRFALEKGFGATIEVIGDSTKGMVGTGFIYTNKESISIGTGALMSQLIKSKMSPNDLLESFKNNPMVKPLIRGGETKEYAGHMIPEGGYNAMPKLYGNGVLVAGDAAQMVNGLHREGSNMAMISGKIAGETVIAAASKGNFSEETLSSYQKKLEDTFIIKDLKKYKKSSEYFDHNPELFALYPELVSDAMYTFFNVDGTSKKDVQKKMMKDAFKKRPVMSMAKDVYNFWRVLV